MATASSDNVEDGPALGLGVMMKSCEDGTYQNKLVNKIVGTKPKWHIKEQPVPTGPVGACSRAWKGHKPDTQALQMKFSYSI